MNISLLVAPMFLFQNVGDTSKPIYSSNAYKLYSNKVVQENFVSKAISRTELESNYKSAVDFKRRFVEFKFSINSRDNELRAEENHLVTIIPSKGKSEILVKFGQRSVDTVAGRNNELLENDIKWTVKLDFRDVLKQFNEKGYYELVTGEKIYKNDFKGVYIAGNLKPMSWDFENLYTKPDQQLTDKDGDGIYELELTVNPHKEISDIRRWSLSRNVSNFPQFHSDYVMLDALYNLALEEADMAVEKDSTFRTGALWGGVWTRDISYSIYLAQAILNPEVAKKSLLCKVQNDRIIQDTGTGGSWPVSTDRVVWAMAAWEVYCVTGDKQWLETIYKVIKNTLDDDRNVAYDSRTGLMYGESSFLDWREQEYPKWMRPIDIYLSQNLGTNAVHYKAYEVLSEISDELGINGAEYKEKAEKLKAAINEHLWMADKGYYGQFLYGKNYLQISPRCETLGEALSVIFGIADPQRTSQVVSSAITTEYGTPCFAPQIPNINPYHNSAIWPFVQSYWTMAAAKAGNEDMVLHSMASVYRPAALFLSNWENMVVETGDYKGTAINSNVMLWSISGNLAHVYRVFYGMNFGTNGINFTPFVPQKVSGLKKLTNFKYRNALLDITLNGYGNKISSFKLDGVEQKNAEFPASLKGKHNVEIVLNGFSADAGERTVNMQNADFSLPEMSLKLENNRLMFDIINGAVGYRVYRNGKMVSEQIVNIYNISDTTCYQEFTVSAVDANGVESFVAKPVGYYPSQNTYFIEAECGYKKSNLPYKGFEGDGFVELTTTQNTKLTYTINVKEAGKYFIDMRYSNGSGPINTKNMCAIRTLTVNGSVAGAVVMPQMGENEWSSWIYSNSLLVDLKAGDNKLSLEYLVPQNVNMNVKINEAMLDKIRIVKAEL